MASSLAWRVSRWSCHGCKARAALLVVLVSLTRCASEASLIGGSACLSSDEAEDLAKRVQVLQAKLDASLQREKGLREALDGRRAATLSRYLLGKRGRRNGILRRKSTTLLARVGFDGTDFLEDSDARSHKFGPDHEAMLDYRDFMIQQFREQNETALLKRAEESFVESVSYCSWDGVYCDKDGMGYVQELRMNLRGRSDLMVPPSITKLTRMELLAIRGARKHGFSELPDFSPAVSLKKISILRGRFKELPRMPSSIQRITIAGSHYFERTAPGFDWGSLTHLRNLTVSSRSIHADFFNGIEKAKALEKLKVNFNKHSGNPEKGYSGDLPTGILQLRHLNSIEFFGAKLVPGFYWKVTTLPSVAQLRVVQFRSMGLRQLPPNLAEALQVESVYFKKNNITVFPHWLSDLPKLRYLDMSGNGIQEAPEKTVLAKIQRQAKVVELSGNPYFERVSLLNQDLTYAAARELLIELGELNTTRAVPDRDINPCLSSYNYMFSCDASGIKQVRLVNFGLTEVPKSIRLFGDRITGILLMQNAISRVPDDIFANNTKLSELDLSRNQIDSIPASIYSLPLRDLHLNGNRIKSFSNKDMGKSRLCATLTRLEISSNMLTEFPEDIVYCPNLAFLLAASNSIELIPRDFSRLTRLQHISFFGNKLSDNSVENVKFGNSLTIVLFGKNKFTRIPKWDLPDSHVDSIDLSRNEISTIDEDVGEYYWKRQSPIRIFDLSYNAITHVHPLILRGRIGQLELQHNEIKVFPTEGLVYMRVARLLLAWNKIESIPEPMFVSDGGVHDQVSFMEKISEIRSKEIVVRKSQRWKERKSLVVDLDFNEIKTMPRSFIWLLHSISPEMYLFITQNPLIAVPDTFVVPPSSALHFDIFRILLVRPASARNKLYEQNPAEIINFIRGATDGRGIVENPVIADRIRALSGADTDAPVAFDGVWDVESSRVPLFKQCEEFKYRCNGREIGLFRCLCLDKFYAGFDNMDECRQCPYGAFCQNGNVKCVGATFQKRIALDQYSTKMQAEIQCVSCPEGGSCDGTSVVPMQGFWKNSTASTEVHSCPNEGACLGGSDSECARGYRGTLCGSCAHGYYATSSYSCSQCPQPIISIIFFVLSVLGFCAFGLLIFFVAASLLEKQNSSAATARRHKLTSMVKMTVSFLQVLTTLTGTFDMEWPTAMVILTDLFSWVNLDVLKTTSLECVWELAGSKSGTSTTMDEEGFGFKQKIVLAVVIPVLIALSLFVIYQITRMLLRESSVSSRTRITAPNLRKLCVYTNLMVWQLSYLPISYMCIQFFNCVSFDGGQTYYIHADLSTRCYDETYWPFAIYALTVIVILTLGFPAGITAYVLWFRNRLYDDDMLATVGLLYRSYKKKYCYWESVEMLRRVVVGGGVVMLSGPPTFQLSVAMCILFVHTVVHCRCWPCVADINNHIQALLLVLTYFTMSLGILKSLEVPEEEKVIFGVTIVMSDLFLVSVVIMLLLYNFMMLAKEQLRDVMVAGQRHVALMKRDKSNP